MQETLTRTGTEAQVLPRTTRRSNMTLLKGIDASLENNDFALWRQELSAMTREKCSGVFERDNCRTRAILTISPSLLGKHRPTSQQRVYNCLCGKSEQRCQSRLTRLRFSINPFQCEFDLSGRAISRSHVGSFDLPTSVHGSTFVTQCGETTFCSSFLVFFFFSFF